MVKGISRQVVVVRRPDPRLFEEAIFILREDAFSRSGASAHQVMAEARQSARSFVRRSRLSVRTPLFWGGVGAVVGAGTACLVWVLALLL